MIVMMRNKTLLSFWLFIAVILLPHCLLAQTHTSLVYSSFTNPPEVTVNGKQKSLAWSGGANNPQFGRADLNKDGIKDLIIFEPENGVRTFINTSAVAGNPNYAYKPEYANNFPVLYNYMKLADYNRDGIVDLFHRGFTGIGVYTGYYNSSNQLSFKKFKDLYYYYPGGGWYNVTVGPLEIPGIVDIDKDGDLDFFSFAFPSGVLIEWYKNCQVESGLPKDSIKICMNDRCWGRIQDNSMKKWKRVDTCMQWGLTQCKTTQTTDPGNNLCLLDYDGDGDYDFFNGSNVWSDIQLFYNGKSQTGVDSIIAQDTVWSSNSVTMRLSTWPMVAWIDIDNDNDSDLVFSPKAENTQNYKNVVYYRNEGTSAAPNYVYQSDSFIVSDMIDVGTASTPVFYDYNKDGKIDLFVGCEGYYQPADGSLASSISYYENVSTSTQTKFDLKSNDFLGLYPTKTKGASLAIGDIDGDGKDDLLIGKTNGTVEFYQNTAASASVQPVWQFRFIFNDQNGTMDVGDYATPFIYDINKDGKNDIISGSQMGRLFYYKNTGSGGGAPPSFHKVTDSLGSVVITERTFYTYTAPFIGKIDNTGKEYLIIGTKAGILYRYDSVQPGNITKYVRLDSNYSFINVFNRAIASIADIDNDGKYEMAVGNNLGGLQLFKQYYNAGIPGSVLNNNSIKIHPNPANTTIHVSWEGTFITSDVTISLVSVTGATVWTGNTSKTETGIDINTSSLPAGMYYCMVQSGINRAVSPIAIVK